MEGEKRSINKRDGARENGSKKVRKKQQRVKGRVSKSKGRKVERKCE